MSIYQNKTATNVMLEEKRTAVIVSRIDSDGPILIYIEDVPFPIKGMPSPECLVGTNVVKRLIIESLRIIPKWFVLFLNLSKTLRAFNRIIEPVIDQFILKPKHQQSFTKEARNIIFKLLLEINSRDKDARKYALKISDIISHIFEYDNAYRFRVQDILSETTKEKLMNNPRKEIRRLLHLSIERDYKEQSNKTKIVANLLSLLLVVPRYKRIFRKVISESKFKDLQFDEGDRYWVAQRADYNYFGKSLDERLKELKDKGLSLPKFE